MNAQQLHACLQVIKHSKDSAEIKAASDAFVQFREQQPSDDFFQLIMNEILTKSDVQEHAAVLLKSDIDKNGDNCSLYRLSSSEFGRAAMNQLLQHLTDHPDKRLVQIIGAYARVELKQNSAFEEYYNFVEQAASSENATFRELASLLLQQVTNHVHVGLLTKIGIDLTGILQKLLSDKEGKVSLPAMQSLAHMILNNYDGSIPFMDAETVNSLAMMMVERFVDSFQREDFQNGLDMLIAFHKMVDVEGAQMVFLFSQIVTALTAIMNIPVDKIPADDNVRIWSIKIFTALSEHCPEVRKQLREQIQTFVSDFVIPGLVPQQLQNWMDQKCDFHYEDHSILQASSTCIETIAYSLGKQLLNPLLHSIVQQAMSTNDWRAQDAAALALGAAAEGMAPVCKQKDIQFYTQAACQFLKSEHPRVRFDCLNTISIMSEQFEPKIHKYHEEVIKALIEEMNDPVVKVSVHASTAMLAYMHGLDYSNTYQHIQQIYSMVKDCWGNGMAQQANGLSILSSLSEILDSEDMNPILIEFMPSVFESFNQTMEAIKNVEDFDYDQMIYIQSIVQMIACAADSVPELFGEQIIQQVMESFVTILKRAHDQSEHGIFSSTIDSMMTLADEFASQMQPYVDQIMTMFIEILLLPTFEEIESLEYEGEKVKNQDVIEQKTSVLGFIAAYSEQYPQGLGTYFSALFDLMIEFSPFGEKQEAGKLMVLAQLLHVAIVSQQDVQAVHAQLFPILVNDIYPGIENNEKTVLYLDLEQVSSSAQALCLYIRYYCRAKKTNQDADFVSTLNTMLNSLTYMFDKAQELMKEELEVISAGEDEVVDEGDQDEDEAAKRQLFEDFAKAIATVTEAYAQFIIELKSDMSDSLMVVLTTVSTQMVAVGIKSTPAVTVAIHGLALFVDFAKTFGAKTVRALFANLIPTVRGYVMHSKELHMIIRAGCYCLRCYLEKTRDYDTANDGELLGFVTSLFDDLKEDGGEEALGCFDNVCSHLVAVGETCNHGPDFWEPLLGYCTQMESDQQEIIYVVEFFVGQYQKEMLRGLDASCMRVITNLFFGKCYSHLKNSADRQDFVALVRKFCSAHKNEIMEAAAEGSDFVKKNVTNFMGNQ